MLWLGLVEFACQSGEENTRGRLNVPGRAGLLRAPVTVEAAEADRTALSFSLYLRDTQNSHTNTHSLEPNRGSRLTGRPSLIPTQTEVLEPERLKAVCWLLMHLILLQSTVWRRQNSGFTPNRQEAIS